MLIIIIEAKLKNIARCWYNKILSLSTITFTSKCSALLANQFIKTYKTHATVSINSDIILFLYLDLCSITCTSVL